MTDMIAVAYPSETTARQALAEVRALHTERVLDVDEAILITREHDGSVKIHDELHPVAAGAIDGVLWGGLLGLLVLQPCSAPRSGEPAAPSSARATRPCSSGNSASDCSRATPPWWR